jgi:hypothetical protein
MSERMPWVSPDRAIVCAFDHAARQAGCEVGVVVASLVVGKAMVARGVLGSRPERRT